MMDAPTLAVKIPYSPDILWAMQLEPAEFEVQARELLAVKLYESGKLTTGLAAKVAGVPRSTFFYILGRYGISPFDVTEDDLIEDVNNAIAASHHQ